MKKIQFSHTVYSNETTIKKYIEVANNAGCQHVNWDYEWKDANRAVFSFDTDVHRTLFRIKVENFVAGLSCHQQ